MIAWKASVCEACGKPIGYKMMMASQNRFRKTLCITHQIEAVPKYYPPGMVEVKIAELRRYLGPDEKKLQVESVKAVVENYGITSATK